MMVKINFFKYQGAGNDFIVIDNISSEVSIDSPAELSKTICDRHYGVGADGLVILKKQNDQIAWDFFNSDGSFAAMCGNAARCVAKHLYKQHRLAAATVETGAGQIKLNKEGELFSVEMPMYKDLQTIDENTIYVNTGVPHFVVRLHRDEDVFSYIKEYRWHKVAGEFGANISFYYLDALGKYNAKTFERGVEGFTLACGTGAVACGISIHQQTKQDLVSITMPGGELLVKIEDKKVFLIGKAEVICRGDFYV